MRITCECREKYISIIRTAFADSHHGMHVPVLLQEAVAALNPQPDEDVIDATVDGGGHATVLLERIAPHGKLLGIDRDEAMVRQAEASLSRFGERAIVVRGNFSDIRAIAERHGFSQPHAILFDLGISSWHLSSGRGFSFKGSSAGGEPLDMRFNPQDTELTAEAIVNHAPLEELRRIFETYGEEWRSRKLAEAIVAARKQRTFRTTRDLTGFIETILPRGSGRIHPATRIFQALRIAVNDELSHVEKGIREALALLVPGGRLAVISFHSLEDRIAKNVFREHKALGESSRKPIMATRTEVGRNPRARSAKLRVFQKI